MMLTFQIHYHTQPNQQVCICGSTPELGNFDESKALILSRFEDRWFAAIVIEEVTEIEYYYFVRERNETVRREWGNHRKIHVDHQTSFLVQDWWKTEPLHSYLFSIPFTQTLFGHHPSQKSPAFFSQSLLLNILCPYVKKGEVLVVSGSCEALGNWNLQNAVPCMYVHDGEWQIVLNADDIPVGTRYKFVIIDAKTNEAIRWEEGDNRVLAPEKLSQSPSVFAETGLVFGYPDFQYKGVGTAIPVFSLRTNNSFGIGDFLDLRKIVDWAVQTHQQLIQILPIHDTTTTKTWRDSYPYSAISIYALHPIYLGCSNYPLRNQQKARWYAEEGKYLNELSEVDYEKVLRLKLGYARALFLEEGESTLLSPTYQSFYETNKEWLFAYACFCYLRDKYQTAQFTDWGEYSQYDEGRLHRLLEREPQAKREVDFYSFMQFLLYRQLSETKEYAHRKGVVLKGDIPIGINRNSVDAWTSPHLFHMDTQTGAPPDDFSVFGQNWGFPTYNWQAMENENYMWWKNRFQKMADYFDAYRIDHILGFFRIWEIPIDAVQGLLGHFSPALPYSMEEIKNKGIQGSVDRLTKPFIHESFLSDLFGDYTDEVKTTYLKKTHHHQYRLNLFCDTQQKVKHLFDEKADEKSAQLYNGLLTLCANVLFIRDKHKKNHFHPRISAQNTYSFRYLDEQTQENFNRLYNEFFYHRHNEFWRDQAMKKLPPLLSSTSMLACGEDLGMIPDCVPPVMHELKILSLEIERMPKEPYQSFTDLGQIPYLSVCTTSTHDMSPIRLWWKENREHTQRYYNKVLHREDYAPHDCTPEICQQIVRNHLQSPAMWVVIPWQDWMSIDEQLRNPNIEMERINIPSNPNHYWGWRMHISLDELMNEDELNEKISSLTKR